MFTVRGVSCVLCLGRHILSPRRYFAYIIFVGILCFIAEFTVADGALFLTASYTGCPS